MNETHINIAIYLDKKYAIPASVMVRSVIENHRYGLPLQLFILGLELDEETKRRMAASWPVVKTQWLDVDLDCYGNGFSPSNYLSKAAYIRLLIDRYLPKSVEKVITLDCDGIMLADVEELWNKDPEGCVLAVPDPCLFRISEDESAFIQTEEFKKTVPYFNSGLMLIDLKKWREKKISEQCLELAAHNPGQALYADQSLLNAVLIGEWDPLPLRWNCNLRHLAIHAYPSLQNKIYPFQELIEARDNPAFIHFLSRRKPWQVTGYHPHRKIYEYYLEKTAWTELTKINYGRMILEKIAFPLRCYWQTWRCLQKKKLAFKSYADFTHFIFGIKDGHLF